MMAKEGETGTGPFVMGICQDGAKFAIRISSIICFAEKKSGIDIHLDTGKTLFAKDATLHELLMHVQGVK